MGLRHFRAQQETRPDGTITKISYAYCQGVNGGTDTTCPANGAFLVTVTTLGNDRKTQIVPTTRAYYDGLSRAIAADVQGFDGSYIRTGTIYDANGRVHETSRPYFLSGGTPKYTTFTYDDLGRVIKAVQPDNGYAATAYAGLSTTVTVHLIRPGGSWQNQFTTTVKNDLGKPASVTDAATNTTTYTYDAVGDLLVTADPANDQIVNVYDRRGRKTQSNDPDMGTWTYQYDSLGRLVSQTDAMDQTAAIVYDPLGRMKSRSEPGMSSSWQYDTAPNGIGKLAEASCSGTACPSGGYTRDYSYDSLGREHKLTIAVGGQSYDSDPSYDPVTGKLDTEQAFSGYATKNVYNPTGYLSQIQDATTGFAVWTANARDAELHLISQIAGNGVTTTQSFDPDSGRVETISAGLNQDANHEVANLGYGWGTNGNLYDRTDALMTGWQQENFCYDTLNRLQYFAFGNDGCTGGGNQDLYDALGNITSKGHVGTYSYPTPGLGAVQPHAVTSIVTCGGCTVNGIQNPTFKYDADGNMTKGAGRTVDYTAFNMAATIASGGNSLTLAYGPDHKRVVQTVGQGLGATVTLYLNDPAAGAMTELVSNGTHPPTWNTYIVADGKLVAERFGNSDGASMRYFTLDHLGSVSVITDESGLVLTDGMGSETGRLSYDPWGAMRNLDGSADTSCSLPRQEQTASGGATRGFTSQEEMPSVCLVNFNARVYDPQVGRFMSADPTVEAPYNPQDLNRYSYAGNNPLSFTDPSGLCFLGCFWQQSWFAAIVAIAIMFIAPMIIGPWLSLSGAMGAACRLRRRRAIWGCIKTCCAIGRRRWRTIRAMLFPVMDG